MYLEIRSDYIKHRLPFVDHTVSGIIQSSQKHSSRIVVSAFSIATIAFFIIATIFLQPKDKTNMLPQTIASTLIVWAITITGICTASPLLPREALSSPGAQGRNAAAATETGVPDTDPTTATSNDTTLSYAASTSTTSTTAIESPATTADLATSSECFPMMAQVDAINSCGKRYG